MNYIDSLKRILIRKGWILPISQNKIDESSEDENFYFHHLSENIHRENKMENTDDLVK